IFKKIYDYSPIPIQNLLVSLKGYELKLRRYNTLYYEQMRYYQEIKDYYKEQRIQIKKLLIHLKNKIPFYNHYLQHIPDSKLDIKVLLSLPVVEKEDLRKNINDFINKNHGKVYKTKTGGTTGKSLNVYSSKE